MAFTVDDANEDIDVPIKREVPSLTWFANWKELRNVFAAAVARDNLLEGAARQAVLTTSRADDKPSK